jgi:hypothetical protein
MSYTRVNWVIASPPGFTFSPSDPSSPSFGPLLPGYVGFKLPPPLGYAKVERLSEMSLSQNYINYANNVISVLGI